MLGGKGLLIQEKVGSDKRRYVFTTLLRNKLLPQAPEISALNASSLRISSTVNNVFSTAFDFILDIFKFQVKDLGH